MDYIVKNKDKKACKFCRSQEGKEIITVDEALTVPFENCTNGHCRCYVALDVEETNNLEDDNG